MIFVDTGAWIAVTDASDQYHRQAVKMYTLRPLHNPHPVIARRLCAVAISLIMVIYEIASSAVASSQRQKQMLCKGLTLLKKQRERFVTTDYVIDETVTRLRYDAGHPSALRYLDLLA